MMIFTLLDSDYSEREDITFDTRRDAFQWLRHNEMYSGATILVNMKDADQDEIIAVWFEGKLFTHDEGSNQR